MEFKKESIFISGLRSFTKVLCGFIAFIIGGFILFFALGTTGSHYVMPKTSIHVVPNGDGVTQVLHDNAPLILRIDIEGVIGQIRLNFNTIEKTLSAVRSNPRLKNRLKGVLLFINSPGGTASDSEEIYQLLQYFKKDFQIPIYAYVNGLCASGGMMIACSADQIYANSSSVIGSVGVIFGPNFNYTGLMEKLGIAQKTITQGEDKDTLNPFRPWKPNEEEDILEIAKSTYHRFVSIVSENRPKLTPELLMNKYGARVYSAQTSEALGYIDHANASYSNTLKDLAKAAKIEKDEDYQVLAIRPLPTIFSDLFEQKASFLAKLLKGSFGTDIEIKHPLSDKILLLYQS